MSTAPDSTAPVYLFTDFGWSGPYVGQMTAAVLQGSPSSRVVNLMHDAPRFRPDLAAYLLPRCVLPLEEGAVIVAVVDPGVGGAREALIVETDRHCFVGPDNGLLSRLDNIVSVSRIDWRPGVLAPTFHGRDLFAPVAARLATRSGVASSLFPTKSMVGADWPDASPTIVYTDAFGNLMLGVPANRLSDTAEISVGGELIHRATTFSDVPLGGLFWYPNSLGLIEIAANRASAAAVLSLETGDKILLD